MPTGQPWSHQQLLVAFRLYCGTPFGKLHQHNPEIIRLANLLGRTPSALGMKACNFADMEPALTPESWEDDRSIGFRYYLPAAE